MTIASSCPPWKMAPLDEWSIVGMNHYRVAGEKRLFVAMTKGSTCIVEEGGDDAYLWSRLWRKACEIGRQEEEMRRLGAER